MSETGKLPNFLTVDFYEAGDVFLTKDMLNNDFVVCSPPTANFLISTNGLTANFANASITSCTVNYLWTFGDNIGVSANNSPTYTYAVSGTYATCLLVTDSCGTDSICQTVTVADT